MKKESESREIYDHISIQTYINILHINLLTLTVVSGEETTGSNHRDREQKKKHREFVL